MLEEAIALIEKQIEMYTIQEQNIEGKPYSRNIPNKVRKRLTRQIQLWKYILKVLERRGEKDANQKGGEENR